MLLPIFNPIKKYRKKIQKIQEDAHEESLKDFTSWC
jgi:hypothetical protein